MSGIVEVGEIMAKPLLRICAESVAVLQFLEGMRRCYLPFVCKFMIEDGILTVRADD